jgi:hypothetical protein
MKTYIGTKIIKAEQMTVQEFNEQVRSLHYSGEDQNGYKVIYEDGYESWSPKAVFEKAYRETCGMTFGLAIEAMKNGLKVARAGWNGKGMWLGLVESQNYIVLQAPYGNGEDSEEGDCKGLLPWIGMKTADGKFVPWLASQTDVLSEDWMLVE